MFSGKKLSNGNGICNQCFSKLSEIAKDNISHLTEYDVKENYLYVEEISNHYKKIFIETAYYGDLHIDEINGLFAFCKKSAIDRNGKIVKDIKDIYHCLNLSNISITIIPNKRKSNRNQICGTVKLIGVLEKPQLNINRIIKDNAFCKLYEVDDEHLGWSEPNDLIFFKNMFNKMIDISYKKYEKLEEEKYKDNVQHEIAKNEDIEYIKAKAVFMLDGNDFSKEDIRRQRNLLLKTFHPDESIHSSSKYAQEINRYYQILLNKVEEKL